MVEIHATLGQEDQNSILDHGRLTPSVSDNVAYASDKAALITIKVSDFIEFTSSARSFSQFQVQDDMANTHSQYTLNASMHVADLAYVFYDKISYRGFSIKSVVCFQDKSVFRIKEIAEAINSYFPDYFYSLEPYSDLIDGIVVNSSLSYGLADLIKIVYSIDDLPIDSYFYTKLLKVIGINYDFSDYPADKLKWLIRNYLSIRKHRGTKDSILALLRSMDFEFIDNPSNPCPIEISYKNNYPISNNITLRDSSVLRIGYENIPSNFYDLVYKMLGKVIPTGIKYELVSKILRVSDIIGSVIDRILPINPNIRTINMQDVFSLDGLIAYKEFSEHDLFYFRDRKGSAWQEKDYFEDQAYIKLHLSDEISTGAKIKNYMSFSEEMQIEDDYQKLEKEGKLLLLTDTVASLDPGNDTPSPISIENVSFDVYEYEDTDPYFDSSCRVYRKIEVSEELELDCLFSLVENSGKLLELSEDISISDVSLLSKSEDDES